MPQLHVSDLPRQRSRIVGRYRLSLPDKRTAKYQGAAFVDGVTVRPVTGRAVLRLHAALKSRGLVIEPWDAETLELVVQYLQSRGKADRAAELGSAQQFGTAGGTDGVSQPPKNEESLSPSPVPSAEPDRDELMVVAQSMGLNPRRNASAKRLQEMIDDHQRRDAPERGEDPSGD